MKQVLLLVSKVSAGDGHKNRANLPLNFEENCELTQSNEHQKSRYWHEISILVAVSELQHGFVFTVWTSKGKCTWNKWYGSESGIAQFQTKKTGSLLP